MQKILLRVTCNNLVNKANQFIYRLFISILSIIKTGIKGYDNMNDKAWIIRFIKNKGEVILISPHLEENEEYNDLLYNIIIN